MKLTQDQLSVLKTQIEKTLDDYHDVADHRSIDFPEYTSNDWEISTMKRVYAEPSDLQVDRHFFVKMLEFNVLSSEDALDFIYENSYDYEWFDEDLRFDGFKQKLMNSLMSENEFQLMSIQDLRELIQRLDLVVSSDMTFVSQVLFNNYVQFFDSDYGPILTLEEAVANHEIKNLIVNHDDHLLIAKSLEELELFDYLESDELVDIVLEAGDSSTVALEYLEYSEELARSDKTNWRSSYVVEAVREKGTSQLNVDKISLDIVKKVFDSNLIEIKNGYVFNSFI